MLFERSKNVKTQPLRLQAVSLLFETLCERLLARAFTDLRAKEDLLTF